MLPGRTHLCVAVCRLSGVAASFSPWAQSESNAGDRGYLAHSVQGMKRVSELNEKEFRPGLGMPGISMRISLMEMLVRMSSGFVQQANCICTQIAFSELL